MVCWQKNNQILRRVKPELPKSHYNEKIARLVGNHQLKMILKLQKF